MRYENAISRALKEIVICNISTNLAEGAQYVGALDSEYWD